MLHAVGIGDLHFDGKLSKYIPEFNRVIANELRSVLTKARRKGITLAFLYGDMCERSSMTLNAHENFLKVLHEFNDFRFIVYKGNHDASSVQEPNGPCSLDFLSFLSESKILPNLKVIRHEAVELFTNTDHPIRVLPWPLTETKSGFLNLLHTEAAGSKWETGREVTGGFSTKHLCVVGHIHTAQHVRNTHFSGTLYQTTFGEDPSKYFHEIEWTGEIASSKIKLIPHAPKYTLSNAVVKSADEYKQVCAEVRDAGDTTLWKVFIHSKVLLPVNAFEGLPTVIKHTPYSTKAELKALVAEELELDDLSQDHCMSMKDALITWMDANVADGSMRQRALKKFNDLTQTSPYD